MLEAVSTLEERIRQIASDMGLDVTGLAKTAKISRATLYAAFKRERERGFHNVDTDTAAALARVAHKSTEWILTGQAGAAKRAVPEAVSQRLRTLSRRLGIEPGVILAHWVDIESGSSVARNDGAPVEAVSDIAERMLMRDRKQLEVLAHRLVLTEETVTLLAQADSSQGRNMDGLPEHIRRAALAAAYLEDRSVEDATAAAERALIDLGPDHAKSADGWVNEIRKRLNQISGTRLSSGRQPTAGSMSPPPKGKRPT